MLSDSDRIRLAVALVAVKFKPPDMSFASYALDLRSKFAPSTPSAPTTDDPWRTRALLMERNYAELQEKYETEKIKLLAVEQEQASLTSKKKIKKKASPVEPPDSGYRSKSDDMELKSMLKRLHDKINTPIVSDLFGNSILFSLNSIVQLTSVPDPQPTLLLSVTIRTIEAFANALRAVVLRPTSNVPPEAGTVKLLSVLLYHMLDIVIPHIALSPDISPQPNPLVPTTPNTVHEKLIDTLLERTSTLILNPLIHSFISLSQNYLDAVLIPSAAGGATNATTTTSAGGTKPPDHKSTKPAAALNMPADIRGDVLSLFSVVFRALATQLQRRIPHSPDLYLSLHTLRASLILETVREFERTSSSVPASYGPSVPGGNTDDPVDVETMNREIDMRKSTRVKRLAMKDARWYMCTIMHIVLSEASETSSTAYEPLTVSIIPENPEPRSEEFHEVEARRDARPELGHLLDKGISDALYRLITKCKKTAPSPRHDETRDREFNSIRDGGVLGQSEGCMEKERQESCAQLQGRAGDRMKTPTKGHVPGKPEAQSAIGDSRPNAGANNDPTLDVGVSAGGRSATQSSRVQGAESVPLGAMTSNRPEIVRDDEMIDLDEVEYGMLLGVIERYWIWSESSETLTA